MWASGDGGEDDDCAADGYVSSIYTIAVGAVGVDGLKSPFHECCPAKMVAIYVTNDDRGCPAIVSVKICHWYVSYKCRELLIMMEDVGLFGGTSAAAAIVAGSVALALEAKLVNLSRHKTLLESSGS